MVIDSQTGKTLGDIPGRRTRMVSRLCQTQDADLLATEGGRRDDTLQLWIIEAIGAGELTR